MRAHAEEQKAPREELQWVSESSSTSWAGIGLGDISSSRPGRLRHTQAHKSSEMLRQS